MANNTIQLSLKVKEDGSLQIISTQAEKASKSLDRAGTSARTADRRLKGVGQQSSNTSKNFAKMAQGITGGLVPAYATLAAHVFALSAAFLFFKNASDVRILEQTQISYAANTGVALQTITSGLREAAGGMLTFQEAAAASAIGVAKGFSPKQMEDLAKGARKAAAALGRDFGDAFDRLIRGASKAEPELLDELGITLKLGDATERYGRIINKNAKDLTASERSQAVLLETQRQLNELFGEGEAAINPFIKLSVTFNDLVKTATQFLLPIFEGLASVINKSALAAVAVFGSLGLAIFKAMLPVNGINKAFKEMETKSSASVDKAKQDIQEYKAEIEKTKKALEEASRASVKTSARAMTRAGAGTESVLVQKASKGLLTDPKQIGQLKSMLTKAEKEWFKHGEIRNGVLKGANLEMIQNLKSSLDTMGRTSLSFWQREKMVLKKYGLYAKQAFATVKKAGVWAYGAIGRAAQMTEKAVSKVLKVAGFIGMLTMVWEIAQQVMQSPYDIALAILKGIDFILNGLIKGLSFVLKKIGAGLDFIIDGWKQIINLLITGYNLIPGVDPITPLEVGVGSLEKKFSILDGVVINTLDTFKDSSWGKAAHNLQITNREAAKSEEAFDGLKNTFQTMGKDLNNVIDGLTDPLSKQTEAQKGMSRATYLGSAAISDQIAKIRAKTRYLDADGNVVEKYVHSGHKRAELYKDLRENLAGLALISPLAARALQQLGSGGEEELSSLEVSARGAEAAYNAMKDGIASAKAAITEGNLEAAESALLIMKSETAASVAAYKLIGETEAAKKVQEDYNNALGDTIGNTDAYYNKLVKLREELERNKIAEAALGFVVGKISEVLKAKLEIAQLNYDIQVKENAIALEQNSVLRARLENELKILKIKKDQAGVVVTQAYGGQMMGDAARTSGMVSSTAATLSGDASVSDKINAIQAFTSPMLETLKSLGPDGELITSVVQGALAIGDAWATAMETINSDASGPAKLAAGLQAVGATVSQLGQMMDAQSRATIAGIDKEIEAEQKRDGKSKESVAKIAQLEKKKEAAKKKQFEMDKKIKLASAIIATALGITNALAEGGPIMGPILATMIGAMGAAQIAIISGMSYQGGASSAAPTPTSISVGERSNTVDLAKARSPSGELAYARGAQGTGTGMTNYIPSAFTGRAAGGNTSFMVGEQGPEIFTPDRPGRITPADEVSAGSAPMNINFSINAIDTQGIEEVLISQRGNLIGMLREAANAHGENFMEKVNVNAYTSDIRAGHVVRGKMRTE